MQKMGLYNEFGEKLGSVEFDGNFYCNGHLYGYSVFDLFTPHKFWSWVSGLGLCVGSF